ncbi:MAG TPA: cation diffusion facilitator family transporter [Candidatus Dormibacteraeota bacterium]|nr:cation diffusion facilitator family transporter [Candidatus Dormibacteraeota bacterium]
MSDHHRDEGSYADAAARRAVIVSAVVLAVASAAEFFASSRVHSAGVLADALHNAGDAVTTMVLLGAFAIARRPATHRFTSGFGRVEDVATLVIVVVILITAAAAAFESIGRLLSSEGYTNPYAGLAATAIAAIANFGVSEYKVRVGRRIRSLALEADGLHSRLDGLVSAGAFAGLGLAWMGFAIADSLAGVFIALAIIYILAGTVGRLVLRMMDAVDPALIEQITGAAANVDGVLGVHDVRARWVGRELVAVLHIDCPPTATLAQAHDTAQAVEKEVAKRVPAVHLDVHMDPGTGAHSHSS